MMDILLPSYGTDGVLYFAYGANMSPKALGRRKVQPEESFPAVLKGWALSFRMLGLPYAEPGFATIEHVNGRSGGQASAAPVPPQATPADSRLRGEVHGVLHRITPAEWVGIMATEGVGAGKSGYRVVEVEVELYDGRRARALTLEGQEPSLHAAARPVAPSRRYLDLLREGARHHGLDPGYVTYLDSVQPYEGKDTAAAAVGKAAAFAMALPFVLPLVPPVLMLRMARERSLSRPSSGGQPSASGNASGAVRTAGAAVSAAQDASDMPSKAAAALSATTPSGPAAPPAPQATRLASQSALPAGGPLPPELTRPPLVLPSLASVYFNAVQRLAWTLHDYVTAPLLGSGSTSTSSSTDGSGSQGSATRKAG